MVYGRGPIIGLYPFPTHEYTHAWWTTQNMSLSCNAVCQTMVTSGYGMLNSNDFIENGSSFVKAVNR